MPPRTTFQHLTKVLASQICDLQNIYIRSPDIIRLLPSATHQLRFGRFLIKRDCILVVCPPGLVLAVQEMVSAIVSGGQHCHDVC